MEEKNNKSSLEEFQEKLYAKKNRIKKAETKLRQKTYDIKDDFGDSSESSNRNKKAENEESYQLDAEHSKQKMFGSAPFRKLFFASIAFFLIAGGVAGALIWTNSNVVSVENIELDISAPTAVRAGESAVVDISVTNRNAVPLLATKVLMNFPEGTRKADDLEEKVNKKEVPLGKIEPGETKSERITVAFFGDEDTKKPVEVILKYKLQSSDTIFSKDGKKMVTLGSSPVAVEVNIVRRAPSDQNISLEVTLSSNSDERVENLILEADYPQDFDFGSSTPKTAYGNATWDIGILKPGEEKTVTISGLLGGVSTEQKIFQFQTGLSTETVSGIAVLYGSMEAKTIIEDPFVLVDISLEGEKEDVLASGKEAVDGTISWKNNSESTLTNLELLLSIEGGVVKQETLFGNGGFYDSEKGLIVWNTRTSEGLDVVSLGYSDLFGFKFETHQPFSEEAEMLRNPEITMKATVHAERVSESGVSDSLGAVARKSIKISTKTRLTSKVSYDSSPFDNSGPIPPEVGEQTTYTIFWTLENAWNAAKDVTVTARLPEYIAWGGEYIPQDENIAYNETTGEVVWNVGRLKAGTGSERNPRQVAFQIVLTPSVSQVGEILQLISGSVLEGVDAFTGAALHTENDALSTEFGNNANQGVVIDP